MAVRRVLIAIAVVLAAFVVYGLVWSPRPTQSEKDTAAVLRAADRVTHQEIADAWAQSKLGNARPMERIGTEFPRPLLTIQDEGPDIVLTFAGHDKTCIQLRSGPDDSSVFSRPC
jgi:hypothetical protein